MGSDRIGVLSRLYHLLAGISLGCVFGRCIDSTASVVCIWSIFWVSHGLFLIYGSQRYSALDFHHFVPDCRRFASFTIIIRHSLVPSDARTMGSIKTVSSPAEMQELIRKTASPLSLLVVDF